MKDKYSRKCEENLALHSCTEAVISQCLLWNVALPAFFRIQQMTNFCRWERARHSSVMEVGVVTRTSRETRNGHSSWNSWKCNTAFLAKVSGVENGNAE